MPLQQMIEQNSYDANDKMIASHQLANELRELYYLPMISKEENKDLMSSHIIINLNGFLKDYATNSEKIR
ncbi:MAG: hypothetical protein ACTHKC_06910 [Candidatus Nitrosocosmicus sp.]